GVQRTDLGPAVLGGRAAPKPHLVPPGPRRWGPRGNGSDGGPAGRRAVLDRQLALAVPQSAGSMPPTRHRGHESPANSAPRPSLTGRAPQPAPPGRSAP